MMRTTCQARAFRAEDREQFSTQGSGVAQPARDPRRSP